MADRHLTRIAGALLQQRERFKAFLVQRVGQEAEAEDLLQSRLVKALQHADEIADDEKVVAWFHQILRNVLVDLQRSRAAARRREDAWANEAATLGDDGEAERQICACVGKLLPALKPVHAEVLRRVELDGERVHDAARAVGITPNHASVTLHRARTELRGRLIDFAAPAPKVHASLCVQSPGLKTACKIRQTAPSPS